MPRIRTVKPDYWSDSKVMALSRDARLMFIGMWNFADDHGGIEADMIQLKARIFPGDSMSVQRTLHEDSTNEQRTLTERSLSVQGMVDELLRQGLLIEYSVNGTNYYHIKNFRKHQSINRPSMPRCPPYGSVSTHGALPAGSGSGSGSGRGKKEDLDLCQLAGSAREDGAGSGGNGSGAIPPLAPDVQQLGEILKRRRKDLGLK